MSTDIREHEALFHHHHRRRRRHRHRHHHHHHRRRRRPTPRAQELCEKRGGRPGPPVPNKPTVSVDWVLLLVRMELL